MSIFSDKQKADYTQTLHKGISFVRSLRGGLTDDTGSREENLRRLKDEIEKYKADAEKLPGVQKELDKMKESAEQESKDPYKVKYEAMKEEFEKYKTETTEKETARQKEEAYRELLKSAGISEKRINSVLKVTDLKSLKLDAEGKLEDKENLTRHTRRIFVPLFMMP